LSASAAIRERWCLRSHITAGTPASVPTISTRSPSSHAHDSSSASRLAALGLVSGSVVMNSMVMELPREKEGRFWPFVFGALVYTLLLALVR
jgi:hypothetical protein